MIYFIKLDRRNETQVYPINGYGVVREKGEQHYEHRTVSAADLLPGDWFAADLDFGQIKNIWKISAVYNGQPGDAYRVHTETLHGEKDTDILGDMAAIDIYRPLARPTLPTDGHPTSLDK